MKPDFWHDKKVLVTGHTGFKGSWLSLWLQSMGARVTGFSLDKPSSPCLFDLAGAADGINNITGDVRDVAQLTSCLTEHGCEIIIHLAAQSLVRRSYREPLETYSTNVMGTANVLEAARAAPKVRVVIIVTSDKCYENREQLAGYRESDPMGGYDPYSSSKGCAELVTAAWRNSYFNPAEYDSHGVAVASARAGNVIGGGDWGEHRIVPDIMEAFNAGEAVSLRNPDAIRPWQFVMEPLNGYLVLAERMWDDGATFSRAWNFGPADDELRSVAWLTDQLAGRWGSDARSDISKSQHPHETTLLKLDSSRASSELNWRSLLGSGETLDWIVEWYRGYYQGSDVRQITLNQIQRFQEKVLHE
ncbi:MAG: CDP-glucose 4,6-dehydratase [Gammaproteobacteria bacterium]|nr:CDP-glucose 4,6-dehydratase [Gammaproteobacteria bacterium]